MTKHIVVVGAGVAGLSTALALLDKGFKVTILAQWQPGDMHIEYTSPWAGAHWRTMAPNSDKLLQEFDAATYRKFMQLSRMHPKETGIMIIPSTDYYDELTPETTDPWFRHLVSDFQFVPKESLPTGAKIGHRYTTVVVNAPHYIRWLQHQFISNGGKMVKRALAHINEAFDLGDGQLPVDAVVNCTGLGARYLGGVEDDQVYPTRGQTVVAYAPSIKETITHLGKDHITYVIPRSDGTVVLGGTANKNDFNPNPEKATITSILERTRVICPKLKDLAPLKIVRNGVGLRPSRINGVRIENQYYTKPNGSKILVTHAYGHGGFGYQSSVGAAEYTASLVEKGLVDNAKL